MAQQEEKVFVRGVSVPQTAPGAPSVGVVLEGGGFRGMYTAGITDVWMERGFTATATVGVSAGATFGCNFKSLQIGRSLRYNKRFCADPRYASLRSLLTTGDLFNKKFAYGRLPWELDVFDVETFQANPMRFTVVATDIESGEAVYHDLELGQGCSTEARQIPSHTIGCSRKAMAAVWWCARRTAHIASSPMASCLF